MQPNAYLCFGSDEFPGIEIKNGSRYSIPNKGEQKKMPSHADSV